MKKMLIPALFVLMMSVLVGCDQATMPVVEEDVVPERVVEKPVVVEEGEVGEIPVPESEVKEGYYLDNQAVMHDGKVVKRYDDLVNEMGFSDEDKQKVGFNEWFQRENNDYIYFYLEGTFDCGGCFVNQDVYLVINKKTDQVEVRKMDLNDANGDKTRLPVIGVESLLSPDKTKAVFSETRYIGPPETRIEKSFAHVYNFLTDKIERTVELPEGKSIIGCGIMYCEVSEKAVKWDESKNDFVIEPMDEDEDLGDKPGRKFQDRQ